MTTTTTRLRFVAAVLAACVTALTALVPPFAVVSQANAGTFIYGVDANDDLWEIDPVGKASAKIFTAATAADTANALGYDTARGQILYIGSDNNLSVLIPGSSSPQPVGGLPLGVSTNPLNAAYHNDAFWFFEHNSTTLTKASMSYAGVGGAAVPSITGIERFVVQGMSATDVNTNTFGDIAIDPDTNTLYASTSRGRFYSVDLANPTTSFTQIAASLGNDKSVGLQLSFDNTGNVLYGHNYSDGTWYTVDPATGGRSVIDGFVTLPTGGRGFRDLGGAAPVPEPSTFALAGLAIASALGYRRLNTQKQRKVAGSVAIEPAA